MNNKKSKEKLRPQKTPSNKPTVQGGTAGATDGGSNMEQQLMASIEEGGKYDVKRLRRVKSQLDVLGKSALQEMRSSTGLPVLNYAIMKRNFDIARLLVEKGVNHLLRDNNGQTAVHSAAAVDNARLLLEMLTGGDVNVMDDKGETPLHVAVRNCSVETVKFLVFAGADPCICNKEGLACRMLTDKNQIQQILRDFNPDCRRRTATIERKSPYMSEDMQFSMQLSSSSNVAETLLRDESCQSCKIVYLHSRPDTLGSGVLGEEEEVLGDVFEYRIPHTVTADIVFPRYDVVDEWAELVLRLLFEGGDKSDTVLDIKEGPPWPPYPPANLTPKVNTMQERNTVTSSTPTGDQTEIVSHGCATVALQPAGTLLLVTRPKQQSVTLKTGQTEVTSSVDAGVKLKVPENFRGRIDGSLQLERSPPIKEQPSMAEVKQTGAGAETGAERVFESQGDYIKFTRQLSDSGDSNGQLTVELPIPTEYTDGPLVVYIRRRASPIDVETSGSDTEEESEARRWSRQEVSVKQKTGSLQLPLVANKTMTVVETKRAVPEEKVKKKLAQQYKRRRYKKAVFFIIARPWSGWRECQEVAVVVTSPRKLLSEQKHHLRDGFSLIQLSGELRVAVNTVFRLSVLGDLFTEDGPGEATVTFLSGPGVGTGDNHCKFVVRGKTPGTLQGGIFIEKEKVKKKRRASVASFGDSDQWRAMGQIRFEIAQQSVKLLRQSSTADLAWPFTDAFLMELASEIAPSEAYQLGIKMELTHAMLDGILNNPTHFSPVFRCFEVIRHKRDRCDTSFSFGRYLVKALRSMGWNMICEWLFQQLSATQWERLEELKAET